MKAMVIRSFGGPDVFEERDLPVPQPGPEDVLVRVYATSVNPVDYKIRQQGSWAGIQPPAVLGYDVAGVVEKVGADVHDFKPGDKVFYTPEIYGHPHGSDAEYHVARAAIVAHMPPKLTFEEAASLPLAGGTAWVALVERLLVRPAETVLLYGAGGVGSLGIQIAKAAGARVIAVSGRATLDLARTLGADVVVDYHSQDVTSVVNQETGGQGVDATFDTVGGENLARSIPVTKPHGRLAGIAGLEGDLSGLYPRNQTLYGVFLERARPQLDALRTLVERGQLRPVVDSVLPLTDIAEAHSRLEHGGVRGKIVLRVADGAHGANTANGREHANTGNGARHG